MQRVAGTGTFTDLKLGAFFSTPDALGEMLKWPARLESLTFRFAHRTHHMGMAAFMNWGLDTLHPILFRHKETLRYLRISHLTRGGLDYFNLTEFTGLEHLTLSLALTGTAHIHLANLAAPRLKSFCWDMTLEDQGCSEDLGDFQQREEDWIRALVDMFAERCVPCRHIKIVFTPHPLLYFQSWADVEDLRFPWDRMDDIARDLRPRGIALAYNRPNVTRREFDRILETVKGNQDDMMPSPDHGYYDQTMIDGYSTAGR
ncbi:hypothetical protein GQ53DRAFT_462882 [Thozetella sp. PMI_491]|nr:hypothetical protein GQ53DRAFT_462882 [Thozetella sp. PMI_491]